MADIPTIASRLEDLVVRLDALSHPRRIAFEAGEPARAQIARTLGLVALPSFAAEVELKPWLEGVEMTAHWRGEVVQTCGVSLEDFATNLAGTFHIRALPADSPHRPEIGREVVVDADDDDPPDVVEGDVLDLGGYLVEHLSLELDPFPRKPGAEFEPPAEEQTLSPFASLKGKIS